MLHLRDWIFVQCPYWQFLYPYDFYLGVFTCVRIFVKIQGWESSTGQELFKISPHSDVVRSLAINEDNSVFASGSDDGSVQVSVFIHF